MAKQFPTFRHPSLATPVRLTKAVALELARRARSSGYLNRGVIEGAAVAEVMCPLCRERVQGFHGPYAAAKSAGPALDRAMVEHLVMDCSSVTRPE